MRNLPEEARSRLRNGGEGLALDEGVPSAKGLGFRV